MSQVNFKTTLNGKNIEVVGGWDRPLQGYHFTIYDLDAEEEEEILYCNLDDRKLVGYMGFTQTNEHYRAICQLMGIELPEHFWDACDMKAGNLQLYWNPLTQQYEGR